MSAPEAVPMEHVLPGQARYVRRISVTRPQHERLHVKQYSKSFQ